MNSNSRSNVPEWKEEIRRRLADLRLPPAREAEIVEELAQHIDDRYEELLASGETEVESSRAALAEFWESDLLTGDLRRGERPGKQQPGVFGAERNKILG